MTRGVLAERSGVSLPTVNRVLSGEHPEASFANVAAIAECLGLRVTLAAEASSQELREAQARKKAKRLVGLVQGTSALEGQGLEGSELEGMIGQTAAELLVSNRRLWSE